VVEREHGKTEPGGGHRQRTARALPRGRLPALGSSDWTRVPLTPSRLEAAVSLSVENQAEAWRSPEREVKPQTTSSEAKFAAAKPPETHAASRSVAQKRPPSSVLVASPLVASRRSGAPALQAVYHAKGHFNSSSTALFW
jgi:hypothetical protein